MQQQVQQAQQEVAPIEKVVPIKQKSKQSKLENTLLWILITGILRS